MKEGDTVFNISFDTWYRTCSMYFSLGVGTKKAYLQWFPFSRLSLDDENYIKSEEFYNNYIKTGSFVLYPGAMQRSENYIQKDDGSFRDATLVAPILYLVLQSIGNEIALKYIEQRPVGITAYYAGNYGENRPKYKQEYDSFFKHLNEGIVKYQYFIKTDVTNFFNNISLNLLVHRIDEICNHDEIAIPQMQLHLCKELLSYCGAGKFPLIENSIASSYLATVVYLGDIDCRLHEFISDKIQNISEFEIVRYVDDMYIMFSSEEPLERLNETYNVIRNEYSSLLKNVGLSLNIKKCCIRKAFEINDELKKSLYDEAYNGKKHAIEEHFSGALKPFLENIYSCLESDGLDNLQYMRIIEEHFDNQSIEFTPSEVYNYLIYENETELQTPDVTNTLVKIINTDLSFLSLDPKRLSVMVMKSGNDKAIKAILNRLFIRNRENIWNSYDTTVAIAYLIQSKFQHIDLLKVLERRCPELYEYYEYNCGQTFTSVFRCVKSNRIRRNIEFDEKAIVLYFLYIVEADRENTLGAYAYFKNFFDRTSADLAFRSCVNAKKKGKPNYCGYYKERDLNKLYKGISNAEGIIADAHKIRNANPLAHSSAGLLDSNSSSTDIKICIEKLSNIINSYVITNGL